MAKMKNDYFALMTRPSGSWQETVRNVPPRHPVSIVEKPSPPSDTGIISAQPSGNALKAAFPAWAEVRHPLKESMAISAFIYYKKASVHEETSESSPTYF